ncbi:MAG TPA: ScyD/ScyE family protein [Nostoc sp.]|uniref:ScyD/ScyE family protein n=1 Tax=Nostoc sp. TaxID=1180 RepID=UPI002D2E7785|nr:ScyD/ScyE family protein [Nostoc sp.]HYX15329.1 ScyD/ScyE family protein [Nostoc sp.]
MDEQTPPINAAPGDEDVVLALPAQYSSGNTGFFNRQNESVPTAVTVGPDGALYASELSALPYPEGYAQVLRVSDPEGVASYDGRTPGGTGQIYASGFQQLNGLTFDEDGALYALEYVNATTVYDPTLLVEDLPPSRLIRVDPDGTRKQISGEELRFGNHVLAHEGKVYAAIGNGDIDEGQVLAYEQDAETGEWSYEVVAENLNNPRGMDIGPDGNLYVLETGKGTPADDPNAEDALSIQFIPGLVSQRAGYTGAISRIDLENGYQERIYEGLPSTIEYNPNTGEDRILSIGPNGLAIGDDGTAWIASGGGLSVQTAEALGEFGEGLRGVLRLEGLFGEDPSQATWTPAFDSVQYALDNGPDGATTLFNTQSNLNDIKIGSDGKLYAVDAARNVMYGLSPDGEEVESVTVLQKNPPVLTPPQYGSIVKAGGDPSADYRVEIIERTFKGENDLPDTPGRQQALANGVIAPTEGGNGEPPLRGEDAAIGGVLGEAGVPGDFSGVDGEAQPPDGLTANDFDPLNPTLPPGVEPNVLIPGAVDPLADVITKSNPFADYFDPFFGVYSPARGDEPVLPDGENSGYTVDNLFVFGDRLTENGGEFGKNAVAESAGANPPYDVAPYSPLGNFTDGLNWTTYLGRILGVEENAEQDTNFSYLDATARELVNPIDPFGAATELNTFAGQIDAFEETYDTFGEDDLVVVNFGGNDLTLPPGEGIAPEEAAQQSIKATVDGIASLQALGAKNFLVGLVPPVELAPIFSDPEFLKLLGVEPGFFDPVIEGYNQGLTAALDAYEVESGVNINILDINALFDAIAAEPGAYGFVNVDEPVLISRTPVTGEQPAYNPAIIGQDPAVQHATLFLDPFFHPTALGHSILAETARNELLDLGERNDTITDFGGVGEGSNPSQAVIANLNTLQFTGSGLTAENLQLTQNGNNLEVTFENVASSKVTLQNFLLENLDNLPEIDSRIALGNILFDGQTSITDSFDVINANSTQTSIFNKNTVTFLNDLNNNIAGFDNSDDVINGQGGNDIINALSGNDLLRGGSGDDILISGEGNDTLVGGKDNDIFVGGVGADRFLYNTDAAFARSAIGVDAITDFNSSQGDKIVLDKTTFSNITSAAGTGFNNLSDFEVTNKAGTSTAIIVYDSVNGQLFYNPNGNSSGGLFATLSGAPTLTASDFVLQA